MTATILLNVFYFGLTIYLLERSRRRENKLLKDNNEKWEQIIDKYFKK